MLGLDGFKGPSFGLHDCWRRSRRWLAGSAVCGGLGCSAGQQIRFGGKPAIADVPTSSAAWEQLLVEPLSLSLRVRV